jgi:nicotinamide-nucleotide amidase
MIPNTRASAPGVIVEHQGKTLVFTPGVPREMRGMIEDHVMPYLRARGLAGGDVIRSRILRVALGESIVEDRLRDLMRAGTNPTIAPYAHTGECHLRLTARGGESTVDALLEQTELAIRERLGRAIYASGEQALEETVARQLATAGLTVAVAESCTGGLIAHRLIRSPGASMYLDGGVVAYSNAAKTRWLDVPQALIARYGAVSPEAARAMAEGVRARAETDLALATTGIAGPSGGTPDKPIGLVFIALAHPEGTELREMRYGTEPGRQGIQYLASQTALDMLRLHLLDLGEGGSG